MIRAWSLVRFGLAGLLLSLVHISPAQSLEWSNTQKIRNNSVFTSVVGEDENGIYILRHRNREVSRFAVLERYRQNLGLELSRSFVLKNSRILYAGMVEMGILLIKMEPERKSGKLRFTAILLNSGLEVITEEMLLLEMKPPDAETEPVFMVRETADHSKHVLFCFDPLTLKQRKLRYVCFDHQPAILSHGEFTIPTDLTIEGINDITVYPDLNFTILYTLRKSREKPAGFAMSERYGDTLLSRLFEDSAMAMDHVMLINNPETGDRGVTGQYSSEPDEGFEGDFVAYWRHHITDSMPMALIPYTRSVLKELEGESVGQEGFLPSSYHGIRIILRSDGGFVKLMESSMFIKDQDIVMINGVASSFGKNIYNFDNVLIRNIDRRDSLDFEDKILKNQSSVNDGGILGSVFVAGTPSAVHVIYNDPVSHSGDIMILQVFPDGSRESRILARGDEMNALIIAGEGKQISQDKVIIPVIKDRKFALLKITFR